MTIDLRASAVRKDLDTDAAAPGDGSSLGEIYRVASRLFAERGYDATSMSNIADAAGITKATIYHFVRSKEELLFRIMNFGMDKLVREVIKPAERKVDPEERLAFIIRAHLENIVLAGNHMVLVTDEPRGLGRTSRRKMDARKRAYFELVRRTISEIHAKRRDPASSVDASVGAHSVLGLILWTTRWRKPSGRFSTAEIADHIIKIALKGV